MASFGRGKKFEKTNGFPTILEEEKSLKQGMDFQQSQCKNVLKLWLIILIIIIIIIIIIIKFSTSIALFTFTYEQKRFTNFKNPF